MATLIGLYVLGGVVVVLAGFGCHRVRSRVPAVADRLASGVAHRFGPVQGYFLILVVGLFASVAVMIPIGVLCRALQSSVDEPTYNWVHPRVSASHFTKLNSVLTTMGNRDTIDWIFLVALVLLAFAYGRRWWLPTSALVLCYAVQYKGQSWLASWIHRGHPPGPGTGTFPSGGASRAFMLYGVILVLSLPLLPTLSRAWRAGLFTGLALIVFAESYSRLYLSSHWISDIIAGVVFGGLIVLTASVAVRCADAAAVPTRSRHSNAAASPSVTTVDQRM